MDVVTHGLASYALTRAVLPRASRATIIGAIIAGTVADVDAVSARFGPSAFLDWHRTYAHSLSATLLMAILIGSAIFFISRQEQNKDTAILIFAAVFGAALLHLALDACQNDQLEIFWPFRRQRHSADLLAHFDLWILLILLAGVLLPRLLGLVTEEIGAKSKAPRGRLGAILALAAVIAYIGARFVLHGNALAILESRTYRGESARRIAALAEPDSPLHWLGIVETERGLRELEVSVGPAASRFDPDAGTVAYKPETSTPLEAAQKTEAAGRFLQATRFPKASVEKTLIGYHVEIQAFPKDPRSGPRVKAVIETDANAVITSQQLVWDPAP